MCEVLLVSSGRDVGGKEVGKGGGRMGIARKRGGEDDGSAVGRAVRIPLFGFPRAAY